MSLLPPWTRFGLELASAAERLPLSSVRRRYALAIAAILVACACLVVTAPAVAQRCPRVPDHLILARLTVHEAGWEAEADMRGIHAVLRRIAARDSISFARAACLHSGRALRGETSRAWVAGLDEDGARPVRWPSAATRCRDGVCRVEEHAPWVAFVDRWRRTLELAAHVVAHADATFTDCAPLTWGSRMDVRRGEERGRARFETVDCGETRNVYGRWVPIEIDPE